MTAALSVPAFRALWFAESQSVAGDQLAKVALMILVYSRTGSAWWAAAVYALSFLPTIAGGLWLSQLADRYPRRTLMVTCSTTQAVLVGLMAIPRMPLAMLCVFVVAVTLVQSPALAAQNATTREIFTDDALYLRSQDLRGITYNTLMLLGLAGGGLLVVGIGTSWSLAIDAATFVISALVLAKWLPNTPVAGRKEDGWFGAARWVFGDHRMRVLLTLAWLVGLAVVPEGLAAPLAHQLGASDAAVGWLLAADPLGYVVGTFVLSHYVSGEMRRRLIGVLATASLGVLLFFALHPNLYLALVLLALAGAVGAYQISVAATYNTWADNGIRGGVIGIARTGLRVAQGVGVALGGMVAQLIGDSAITIALARALGLVIAVPATIAWANIDRSGYAPAPSGAVARRSGARS
jgi:predicted MFS family arabinose efflux permease